MDFFQAQDFMKEMYPGKELSYEFDDKCHRTVELIFTDGAPHLVHHVECNKVKVNIPGEASRYVPIAPHRIGTSWDAAKRYMNAKQDVFIHDDQKAAYREAKDQAEKDAIVKQISDQSGLPSDQIKQKLA